MAPASKKRKLQLREALLTDQKTINPLDLVQSRLSEIQKLEETLKASQTVGSKRVFQTIPKHLRRRTASHNPRRVPKYFLEKSLEESREMKSKGKKKKRVAVGRRRAIRSRRYELLMKRQYPSADGQAMWLPSHYWQTKRMKMATLWGFRLPVASTLKRFRVLHRHYCARDKAFVLDSSYTMMYKVSGTEDEAVRLLSTLTYKTSIVNNLRNLKGSRLLQLPIQGIGPVEVLVVADSGLTLYVSSHPSIATEVHARLSASPNFEDITGRFARFTLTGTFKALDVFGFERPTANLTFTSIVDPRLTDIFPKAGHSVITFDSITAPIASESTIKAIRTVALDPLRIEPPQQVPDCPAILVKKQNFGLVAYEVFVPVNWGPTLWRSLAKRGIPLGIADNQMLYEASHIDSFNSFPFYYPSTVAFVAEQHAFYNQIVADDDKRSLKHRKYSEAARQSMALALGVLTSVERFEPFSLVRIVLMGKGVIHPFATISIVEDESMIRQILQDCSNTLSLDSVDGAVIKCRLLHNDNQHRSYDLSIGKCSSVAYISPAALQRARSIIQAMHLDCKPIVLCKNPRSPQISYPAFVE